MNAQEQPAREKEASEAIPWPQFLESQPPGQPRRVTRLEANHPAYLACPALRLYCDSETCGGERFFDSRDPAMQLGNEKWEWELRFLNYKCRHCKERDKIFAVAVRRVPGTPYGEALKLGEHPPFGPHIPTKMFSLLGPDQELFHKGHRAESQGMGIAAFAYYRRVVENQKDRLIDAIIKVAKVLNAEAEIIAKLEAARKETQFHKAVLTIKDGIPDVLRISGHNPLMLLHTALSDGLYDRSDEECLLKAQSIRLVMAELSERIVEALKDHAELNQAVSKLLAIQAAKATSKDGKHGPPSARPPEVTPPGPQQ